MARRKKDLDTEQAPKVGTQHAAVEEEGASVASIVLEDNRIPSRGVFKVMSYQGMNIALSEAESNDEYKSILNRIGMPNQFSMGLDKSKHARLKLWDWKLHLDSCATYHSVFAEWCFENIHEVEVYLK